jgi:hypothetical protein
MIPFDKAVPPDYVMYPATNPSLWDSDPYLIFKASINLTRRRLHNLHEPDN